ncbi:uncharacterized protein LOC135815399 [Sycon ciliatum]|uniref:uncharacterized protein LOC135815399 n=1 Tax=Sycon ciliatum TaxID=27933 RepID=UPI0020A91C66|eukprot:scpid50630/ scgid32121/ 
MADLLLSSLLQTSRATACGLGIHAGSSIVSSILSGKITKSFREWNPATVNCLRFGAFLGGFAGIYRIIRELLQQHGEKLLGNRQVLVAAGIASLVSRIQPSARRHVITLFLGGRALSAVVRQWEKRTGTTIPRSLFLAVFLMNTTALIHAGVLCPDVLPASYYRSLLRWSCRFNDTQLAQLFRPLPSGLERLTCHEIIHPGQTCFHTNVLSFLTAWRFSLKLYAVLCTVPLLFRYKQLLKRPVPMFVQAIKTTARSGLFLALCALGAFITTCSFSRNDYIRHLFNTPQHGLSHIFGLCIGFAGALPVIIEPSSRWYELCMYTTPITIHMIFRHLQLNKFIPTTENFSVFFFATSMMVIMRAYELQRDIIPPWMVSFLNILLR